MSFFYLYCFEQAQEDIPLIHLQALINSSLKKEISDRNLIDIALELNKVWYAQLQNRLQKSGNYKKNEAFQEFAKFSSVFADFIADQVDTLFLIDGEKPINTALEPIWREQFLPLLKKGTIEKILQEIRKSDLFSNINTEPFLRAYDYYLQSYTDFLTWTNITDHLKSKGPKDLGEVSKQLQSLQLKFFYLLPLPNMNGYTLFHLLCEESSISIVMHILKEVGDFDPGSVFPPSTWNPKFLNQALIAAIKNNQWAEAQLSILWGANWDYVSPTKKNILHYAASAGVYDRIPFLIEKGLSVKKDTADGWSSLYWALKPDPNVSQEATLKTCQVLLEAGATWEELIVVNPHGDVEQHPWKLIVKTGNIHIIKLALEEKKETWLPWVDNMSHGCLHWAAEQNNLEVYKFLVGIGANFQQKDLLGRLPCEVAKDASLKAKFQELEKAGENVNQLRVQVENELMKLKENNSWGNMEEVILSKVEELNEPQSLCDLGQLYESKGDRKRALTYYQMAASDGHRRANEAVRRMTQLEEKDIQRCQLLSDRSHGNWIDDFFGQEYHLRQELLNITTPHPVYDSYNRMYEQLLKHPLLEEPLDLLVKIKELLSWVIWSERIQERDKSFTKPELKELQSGFKKIYKLTKKSLSQDGCVKNSIAKLLFDHFNSRHKGKLTLLSSGNANDSISPLPIYTIILPYMMNLCEDLYVRLLPRATQKDHIIWRPITQSLRNLKQYYAEVLAKRWETRSFQFPEEKPILHSLETGNAYLDAKYVGKLIHKRQVSDVNWGTHTVLIVNGVHYKKLLQMTASDGPGIEYAVDCLNKIVSHQGSPPTTLLKVKYGKTQVIYQASKTVKGVDLEYILEYHQDDLDFLDPFNYSAMAVMGMLVMPRDGKPDNYIVQMMPDKKGDLAKCQLISIDNDRAFGVPLMRDNVGGGIRFGVQNVLFFFPQMKKQIDQTFRKLFLNKDPFIVCLRWLYELYNKNEQYEELLQKGIFNLSEYSGSPKVPGDCGLQLPIKIPVGFIEQLYGKISRLQEVLREKEDITHLELLQVAEPSLGILYSSILEDNLSTLQYFVSVWNKDVDAKHIEKLPLDLRETILCSSKIGFDQEHIPKQDITSAAQTLLSMVNIEVSYPEVHELEILLERLQKYAFFVRNLTLWSPVGLTVYQFLSFMNKFPHLENIVFKGKLSWKPEDISRVAMQKATLKITLKEDQFHNIPLRPHDWKVILSMGIRVFLEIADETFSLRCTLDQLRNQNKEKNITDPRFLEFLEGDGLRVSYSQPSGLVEQNANIDNQHVLQRSFCHGKLRYH